MYASARIVDRELATASPRAGWLGTGIANLILDVIVFSVPILVIGACKSVFTMSFTRIFFVLKVNPMNVTGTIVRTDIFSCIELNIAIVFAFISGIAGREAISNFVLRFVVPGLTSYGCVHQDGSAAGYGTSEGGGGGEIDMGNRYASRQKLKNTDVIRTMEVDITRGFFQVS
ncbi:MAG: hypothetical protein Q9186_003821 [Xanthomendoza sp. 1 TL-2023]